MSNIKVEVIKTEDAEGFQSITLKYEGREVETWLELLQAMQKEYEFELIVSDDVGDAARTHPLQSAMTPAIDPDDFDKAVEEVAKTLESPVEWIPVNSSNLAAVAYQEDLKLLLVEFKGGQVYNYAQVSKDVYEGLMSAKSQGSYFASNIKNFYPCEKVNAPAE
jgi:hypothetical protein